MESEEYAIVTLPGDRTPQVWPTGGRDKGAFEAYCATSGVSVVRTYPNPQEAMNAVCLSIGGWFGGRCAVQP